GPAILDRVRSVPGPLLLAAPSSLSAQAPAFVLSTTDPAYRAPAFIGNGAFRLVSSPLGTAPAVSFAAGVYDHAPDDVPRIVALPAWNAIDVSDDAGSLHRPTPGSNALRSHRQTLDLYNGLLHTTYDWVHGARHKAVQVTAFV